MNGFGTLLDFNDLFRHEISIINDRRKRKTLAQAPIVLQNKEQSTRLAIRSSSQ